MQEIAQWAVVDVGFGSNSTRIRKGKAWVEAEPTLFSIHVACKVVAQVEADISPPSTGHVITAWFS